MILQFCDFRSQATQQSTFLSCRVPGSRFSSIWIPYSFFARRTASGWKCGLIPVPAENSDAFLPAPDQNPRTDSGARRKAFRHPAGQALPRPGAAGTASADQSGLRLRHPRFSHLSEKRLRLLLFQRLSIGHRFSVYHQRGVVVTPFAAICANPSHDRQRVPSPARQERTASSSVLHFAQPEPSTWTPESDSAVGTRAAASAPQPHAQLFWDFSFLLLNRPAAIPPCRFAIRAKHIS